MKNNQHQAKKNKNGDNDIIDSDNDRVTNWKTTTNKAQRQLYSLSCGYIRKYLSQNVNPSDIAQIVAKFL